MKRFWDKVQKTNNCWLWTASKKSTGYGTFGFAKKVHKAHRVSWILHNGHIPEGLCVCHKCDNPSCVRPDHLFLGTVIENVRDRDRKKRKSQGRGHSATIRNRKLTEWDVKAIRWLTDQGTCQCDLAKAFGVSKANVSAIIKKTAWSHVGGP